MFKRLWILLRKWGRLILLGIAGIIAGRFVFAFGRRPFGVRGDPAEARRRELERLETERTLVRAQAKLELAAANKQADKLNAELAAVREIADEDERRRRLVELAERVRKESS